MTNPGVTGLAALGQVITPDQPFPNRTVSTQQLNAFSAAVLDTPGGNPEV